MATAKFNIGNSTFRQLLGNGISYHVPSFQRDYSWADDEWDDLWQDILGLFSKDGETSHYMGYLMFRTDDERRFEIIDGQQRLATISILILAALSHLQDLIDAGLDAENNAKRMEQLRSSYIGYIDAVSLATQSKLELNRHNDSYYQMYLVPLERLPQRGTNASERLLAKAFKWFKRNINARCGTDEGSGLKTAELIDELVDKLLFTVIIMDDMLDAFAVFETLNARGVQLSATDLLKNFLFSTISDKNTHESRIMELEDRWIRIVGVLGPESFPEFLRVFWNSRNRLTRKTDLFKTIHREITSKKDAFDLLDNLSHSADVYAALMDPQEEWNPDERKALNELAMFNIHQPFSMIMACHARFFNSDRSNFTKILKAVSVVSFRYGVICGLPSRDQELLYNDIAVNVSNGSLNTYADVISKMREIYQEDEKFRAAFENKQLRTTDSRNKKIVQYILFAIERQLYKHDLNKDGNLYTLEHIFPEHPSDDWSHIEEFKESRMIYRIGNMTLLEEKENRDIGNKGYDTKRKAYGNSTVKTTQAVAKRYDTWDEGTIDSRQEHMADAACGIWKINFD